MYICLFKNQNGTIVELYNLLLSSTQTFRAQKADVIGRPGYGHELCDFGQTVEIF